MSHTVPEVDHQTLCGTLGASKLDNRSVPIMNIGDIQCQVYRKFSFVLQSSLFPKPFSVALAESGAGLPGPCAARDRKSTRLNSSHVRISYAVFCMKKQ